MKHYYLFLLLSIILAGCTKSRERKLTGQIFVDSTNTPLSNTAISLYTCGTDPKPLFIGTYGCEEFSFVTDNEGKFSVLFDVKQGYVLKIGDTNSQGDSSVFSVGRIKKKQYTKKYW